ncbi:glycosyltransferase family 2 protein [Bdellovibrio sp. HCB337]|uniref:glycosyltransferase family 2 protein n=1 Tax=Bdellovibrio sp. HCB337 TaxID=3394358 RepID=UPI0039A70961
MKFYYLIAAYNEEQILERTVRELEPLTQKFPGSEVFLLVNGSNDKTWDVAQKLSKEFPEWVSSFQNDEKGMGVAYRRGLRELQKRKLDSNHWVVLTASDLPFGYSDLDSFVQLGSSAWQEHVLFVGSKSHPQSQVQRNWKRRLGSLVFEIARQVILRIKTKDTQGTLFLRGDQVSVVERLRADDYFITVEIVYFSERAGKVAEMPVVLRPETRNSKISILKDGYKSLRQLLHFRQRL